MTNTDTPVNWQDEFDSMTRINGRLQANLQASTRWKRYLLKLVEEAEVYRAQTLSVAAQETMDLLLRDAQRALDEAEMAEGDTRGAMSLVSAHMAAIRDQIDEAKADEAKADEAEGAEHDDEAS